MGEALAGEHVEEKSREVLAKVAVDECVANRPVFRVRDQLGLRLERALVIQKVLSLGQCDEASKGGLSPHFSSEFYFNNCIPDTLC